MDLSKPHINRDDIESLIGMRVKDISLYQNAFVHRSIHKYFKYVDKNEVQDYMLKSNERIEFLGDLVLGLIVGEYLYERFPDKEDGELTIIKANLVKGETLTFIANKLELNKYLLIGNHLVSCNGKLLENAFESLMGAIYLDLGYDHAKSFWHKIRELYITDDLMLRDRNYKDIITKFCQSNKLTLEYRVLDCNGPSHNPVFHIGLFIENELMSKGSGKRKINAEQSASKLVVNKFINEGKMTNDIHLVKTKKI